MPEQLLDRAQVGATLEQVCGEGMTQPVGVGDEPAKRRGVESPAARRDEEGVLRTVDELRPALVEIARNEMRRLFAERNHAVLPALAVPNVHQLLLEVDVAEIEGDCFCAAEPGRVDELDQRAIAAGERAVAGDAGHDRVDLAELRRIGQTARAAGRQRAAGHVVGPEREAKQRPDGGELARDRGGCELAARTGAPELGHPVGEHTQVDVLERGIPAEPARELVEVGCIRATRRGRQPCALQEALRRGIYRHRFRVRRHG